MGLWPPTHPHHDGERKLLGAQQACPCLSLPAQQALGSPGLPHTPCTTGGTEPGALHLGVTAPLFGQPLSAWHPVARRGVLSSSVLRTQFVLFLPKCLFPSLPRKLSAQQQLTKQTAVMTFGVCSMRLSLCPQGEHTRCLGISALQQPGRGTNKHGGTCTGGAALGGQQWVQCSAHLGQTPPAHPLQAAVLTLVAARAWGRWTSTRVSHHGWEAWGSAADCASSAAIGPASPLAAQVLAMV